MFTVEEVKSFKEVSEELLKTLQENLPNEDSCEDVCFTLNDCRFALKYVTADDVIDEGKYSYGCNYFQLVSYDNKKTSYPTEKNIIDKFNVIVSNSYSKCGSYFSEYEYYYDTPQIGKILLKVVPEIIIPEHEEVDISYKLK